MATVEENRRDLINRLRGSAYAQTSGRLHDADGYCCLGVAVEVVKGPDFVWSILPEEDADAEGTAFYTDGGTGKFVELPGSDDLEGSLGITLDCSSQFAELNDAYYNFKYIARIMEDFFLWATEQELPEPLTDSNYLQWCEARLEQDQNYFVPREEAEEAQR